jgi:O-antigen/teichoic acid export membrane protein
LIAGLAMLAAPSFFAGLHMSLAWMLLLICGSVFLTSSNQMLVASLNLLDFATQFAVLAVLTPLVGLGLSWLLCEWLGLRAEYWLAGLLLGQGLVSLMAMVLFKSRLNSRHEPAASIHPPTRAGVRHLFVYGWPISVAVVFGWGQYQGYRLVMEHFVGLKELGIFVAAYGIALGIMTAVESLLSSLLQPRFYARLNMAGESPTEAWNEYAAVALPILVLTAGTLAAASVEALHIFLAPAYWGTASYVCWAAAIELTRTAANTYSLCMHAAMDTRRLIAPSLIGALLSIGLLTPSVHFWGLVGAGPALTLAGVLYLACWHVAARRMSCISFPLRRVSLAAAGVLVAFVAVSTVHMIELPLAPVLVTVTDAVPLVLVYLLFATALIRPAISDRRRSARQGTAA